MADDLGTWGLFSDPLPVKPVIHADLANDTGSSHTDHLTNDTSISGRVLDNGQIVSLKGVIDLRSPNRYVDLLGLMQPDGTFTIGEDVMEQMAHGALKDGRHTLYLTAKDDDGNVVNTFVTFTLDTKGPTVSWVKLDPTSDTGIKGDSSTESAFVKLQGISVAAVDGRVDGHDEATCVMAGSRMTIDHLELAVGQHTYTVIVTDKAGNETSFTIDLTRVDNTVTEWNHVTLDTIKTAGTPPPAASRALAMESLAVYDVVNLIQHKDTFIVDTPIKVPGSVDMQAAIATAAHDVLKTLYASDTNAIYKGNDAIRAALDDALADALADVPSGSAKTNAIKLGQQVAAAVIAKRAHDGWDAFVAPATEIGDAPGEWVPTPPANANPLLPQWGHVDPFAVQSASQFMGEGPTPLNSAEWATQFNETKSFGAKTGSLRTADQTEIALFWADGAGTYTPPGHWNEIASEVGAATASSTADLAALYAMLNIAMADGAITCWNTKYTKDFWRPVTAIRNGDTDGNAATVADPTWTPLIATPPFPEYTSGHSTFSGAAAEILTALFGNNYHFSTGTPSTDPTIAGITREFESFWAAAQEAGQSRIYGGIHFQEANQDGLASGQQIADWVLEVFGKR